MTVVHKDMHTNVTVSSSISMLLALDFVFMCLCNIFLVILYVILGHFVLFSLAFVVFGLVFSVLSQATEMTILFVEWVVKP